MTRVRSRCCAAAMAACLARPAPAAATTVQDTVPSTAPGTLPDTTPGTAPDLAGAVLVEVNLYRSSRGLHPLAADAHLQTIAQDHTRVMAQQGRLSHGGFQQRFDRSGARLCVENLAAGTLLPAQVVAAWRRSPEHHRNLLEPRVQVAGVAATGSVISLLACRHDGP